MSAFPSAWSMLAARRRTASSNVWSLWGTSRAPHFCRRRATVFRSSPAFPLWPAIRAHPIWRATCAVSPSSSTRQEGNFDLVGNNIPVFFIQDAIKFPDLIHAAKQDPDREFPQAQTAHDTFWDFISLTPESMHMIMWIMSDRAIPRSYRMMEGLRRPHLPTGQRRRASPPS